MTKHLQKIIVCGLAAGCTCLSAQESSNDGKDLSMASPETCRRSECKKSMIMEYRDRDGDRDSDVYVYREDKDDDDDCDRSRYNKYKEEKRFSNAKRVGAAKKAQE